jgi:hypothetical protein
MLPNPELDSCPLAGVGRKCLQVGPKSRMTQPGRKSFEAKSALYGIGPPPRLAAPPELAEAERRVFADIVGACEPEHFRPSDMPLLAAYCRAVVLEQQASREYAKAPVVGNQISAWSIVHANALKSMIALSLRLRLSPQGRAKAVSTKQPMQLSYYERWALEARDEAEQG